MPHKYEAMRDKFMTEGTKPAAAKTKAARIYNAQRKPGDRPVTGSEDDMMDRARFRHRERRAGRTA